MEKALRDSDLGASPRRDGNVIRLTMPELTEERRKEYVKLAKGKAEDGKVAVRNIRRKTKESIGNSARRKPKRPSTPSIREPDAICRRPSPPRPCWSYLFWPAC